MLYVEESNATAVRLYEKRGFTRFSVDVAWHRDPLPDPADHPAPRRFPLPVRAFTLQT